MDNHVIIRIKAMIEDSEEGFLSTTCCIYRVPKVIRKLKKDAYTPTAVSIGPFHYGKKRLQNMERHKWIFFKRFVRRTTTNLDDLVNFVEHYESRVRASYSENIKLSKNKFVEVILVDAGFIIELFRSMKEDRLVNDAKLSKPWLANIIVMDLLLLENQLPFFFLKKLFNRAFPLNRRSGISSFLRLTFDFFSYFNIQRLKLNPNAKIEHFTDLLRTFHLRRQEPYPRCPIPKVTKHDLLYSATELHEAGLKFEKNKKDCLLDLEFDEGALKIPQIKVEDGTETLFRNMIALEQCHYPSESYIIDYTHVLDNLINTSKYVDLLVRKEIIHNYLGDTDEVAKVFNGFGKNIVRVNFNSHYFDTCRSLNRFYKNSWHKLKATLRSDYCKTPWQTAASIAGIFLIILSLVQAISSVLQVAH